MLPSLTPAALQRLSAPFDHPDWLFEMKYDGFRAVAYIERGAARLVSRKGNTYKSFPALCADLARLPNDAILDGEIVCLDSAGRPQFRQLLYRRGEPYFYAFDAMWLDGEDLRDRSLVERKRILRQIVPESDSRLLYVDHTLGTGVRLFQAVCDADLEGIVAKPANGRYGDGWVKIKNAHYSQAVGRQDLFDRRNPGVG